MELLKIKKLPKIELHCHLDGSMPVGLIKELSQDATILADQLQAPKDCGSLKEYLERFSIPLRCLRTAEGLEAAGRGLLEDVSKENVKYIEVRFAPMLSAHEGFSCRQVIDSVLRGLEKGYRQYGVHYNVIVCAMRHHSIEQNLTMLKESRERLGEGVCALDLAGDEAAFETSGFRELFVRAAKWDMPFTIHSGECGSVANVKEAFELGAKRIGHGIALQKDKDLMKKFADHKTGIEMCPTSNLQTKAVERWEEYPLLMYMQKGLKVSVNTDNRTVSNTTMTKELELVYKSCDFNNDIISQLLRNAVETSFADDNLKNKWMRELNY